MKTKMAMLVMYLFLICFFNSNVSFAQNYSLHIGFGLGSTLSKNENDNKKSRGKIQLNGYYNFNHQHAIGLEASNAGSFINSVGGSINGYDYDPITNTEKQGASNMNASTFLAKYKYFFNNRKEGFKPFIELGAGVNTFYTKIFDVPALASQKVKKNNFAFQPEAGFSIGHFQVSLSYLFGGNTPGFTGVNDRGVNILLVSIGISPLYVNASWRFDF